MLGLNGRFTAGFFTRFGFSPSEEWNMFLNSIFSAMPQEKAGSKPRLKVSQRNRDWKSLRSFLSVFIAILARTGGINRGHEKLVLYLGIHF